MTKNVTTVFILICLIAYKTWWQNFCSFLEFLSLLHLAWISCIVYLSKEWRLSFNSIKALIQRKKSCCSGWVSCHSNVGLAFQCSRIRCFVSTIQMSCYLTYVIFIQYWIFIKYSLLIYSQAIYLQQNYYYINSCVRRVQ